MTDLLPIGEFARLTHLNVKTLHHYHEVGLIVPVAVDRASGYRRYSPAQVPAALLARRLRRLDMPIAGVREVLAADPARRADAIAAHLRHMEAELARTREAVASLRGLLADPTATIPVEHRTIAPVAAVTLRRTAEHATIADWCAAAFAELPSPAPGAGPAGALYPTGYFEDGGGEVTAFVPGTGGEAVPGGAFAVALHQGAYADLDRTYAALGTYVTTRSLGAPGPIREHYLVTPADTPDPAAWRTEVCWPVHAHPPHPHPDPED